MVKAEKKTPAWILAGRSVTKGAAFYSLKFPPFSLSLTL